MTYPHDSTSTQCTDRVPRHSWWGAVLGGLVCAGLVVGTVSPSWAGADATQSGSPVVGGFAMGAGVQGALDDRSGGFSFQVAAGRIGLGWDSRHSGVDRFGFGPGWSVAGVGFVDTRGGVRVFPSRSTQGAFPANASAPSGLDGYVGDDVRFSQTPGVLPGRGDGLVGERKYAFVLRELGGLVSYFDAAGDPVAELDAHGARIDWVWQDGHRLQRVVTETGVVTTLDWTDPARVDIETRAGLDGPVRQSGVVELDGGRLAAVTDATGARTTVGYEPSGSASRIGTASGAMTEVTWLALLDGTAAVDRVAVTDAVSGEQITERRWEATAGLASGWPTQAGPGQVPGSQRGTEYRTAVTDGTTRVTSTYDGTQRMTEQETLASAASGDRVLQHQAYTYPDRDDEAPVRADRPTGIDLTHHSTSGAAKTVSESYVFDDLGRLTQRTAADGTITVTEYDDELPEHPDVPMELAVPVGLPVLERTEAPDGSVTESRYTLNGTRTAVIVAETFAGTEAGGALTRTRRSEYVVDAEGFIAAERAFPQGGVGTPLVTEHTKTIDVTAGTMTTTDTIAAGTDLATTTSAVTDLVHGQPMASTDPLGNTTTMTYDPAGRPVEVTGPAGHTVLAEYRTRQHDGVNATIMIGADGVARTEEQDAIGRMTRALDNVRDGVATEGYSRVAEIREYPSAGSVKVTDAWGWATTTEQDTFGRVVRATVSSGLNQLTEHDDVAGTRSTGYTTTGDLADAELVRTQQFDLTGRVTGTSETRADGAPVAPTVREYDGFGRQTRAADGANDARVEYDVHGNPITTTIDPIRAESGPGASDVAGAPLVASRRFDERGTSVEKTLTAAGESRTGGAWAYDLLGREQTVTDQAGTVTSFEYTPDGLIAREESSAGALTANTYDATTRQLIETSTASPVGDPVRTAYEYDETTGRIAAVLDPADPEATTIRYAYDAWGNVTEIGYPDGRSIRHGYDPHGRKIRTTDAAEASTTFRHDAAGLLVSAVQHDADGNETGSVAYTHDDHGRVTELVRGNGVRTEVTFTSASEIASETTFGPDGTIQSKRAYAYDPSGNLSTRTDTTAEPGTQDSVTTTTYAYDLHHRLVNSTVHDGDTTEGTVQTSTEYELNVSGDISRERVTGTTDAPDAPSQTRTREFEYGPTGQMTQISTTDADGHTDTVIQEYDAAGNLTLAADGTRYAYNARNHAVHETTPDGATIRTGYWATGDRATLSTTGEPAAEAHSDDEHTTAFYWDGDTLLNDTHLAAETTLTASYLLGVTREARTLTGGEAGSEVTYAVRDRHGNTTELTDRTGQPTTRYGYTDYGTTTMLAGADRPGDEASRYPFLYAGEYTNPTGTQHLAVRTYHPERMAFTSLDRMPLQNRYAFANANPITNIDPSGHFAMRDFINGLTIGVGALFTVVTAFSTFGMGVPLAASAWAASAAFSTFSWLASTAGFAIATLRIVNDHYTEFLDAEVDERLNYAEYALMGAGALGALGALTAPRIITRWGTSTPTRAARPAPAPTGQPHTEATTQPVAGGPVTNTGAPPASPTAAGPAVETDAVHQWITARWRATVNAPKTHLYQSHVSQHPDSFVGESLTRVQTTLKEIFKNYNVTVRRDLTRSKHLLSSDEIPAFISANKPSINAVESSIKDVRAEITGNVSAPPELFAEFHTALPAIESYGEKFASFTVVLAK